MKVIFDDIIQQTLFELGLKYCYYDDPENPEVSKEINRVLDDWKERLLNER